MLREACRSPPLMACVMEEAVALEAEALGPMASARPGALRALPAIPVSSQHTVSDCNTKIHILKDMIT